jgi:hypothetical protein
MGWYRMAKCLVAVIEANNYSTTNKVIIAMITLLVVNHNLKFQ